MLGAHYLETDHVDFKADTLHKAIIKLHRLNRLQHNSSDDWAQNLLESTCDLQKEEDQLAFVQYLSNPGGYENKGELWDELERWDKKTTDSKILKAVQHDVIDEEYFHSKEGHRVGSTVWIEQGPPVPKGLEMVSEEAEEKRCEQEEEKVFIE